MTQGISFSLAASRRMPETARPLVGLLRPSRTRVQAFLVSQTISDFSLWARVLVFSPVASLFCPYDWSDGYTPE